MKRIRLEGYVGDELNPQSVSEQLDQLGGEDVTIDLHSYGGQCYEGSEIHNRLKTYPGSVTVVMGGIVASIACYIAAAADPGKLIAQDCSAFFMHNAQSWISGDYKAMRKEADDLERLNLHIAEVWAKRNGRPVQEIIDIMEEGKWFYGQEIVDAGFADKLIETGESPISAENAVKKINAAEEGYLKRVAALTKLDKQPKEDHNKKNILKKEKPVKKDELFAAANTLRQNGDISLLDIANAMNLKDQIITPEQKNDLEMVARLNKAGIKDVENELKRLKAIEDEGLKAVTENKLTAEFGPLERKDKSVNLVRQYAEGKYSNGVSFEDIKNDAIYKQLKAADADYTSAQNELEVSETKREDKKDASGVVIY